MAEIPETIKIGYQDVKIIKAAFNFHEDHGKYDDESAEISINTNKAAREILNTVLHEILHAIAHTQALRLGPLKESSMEEQIVTSLGNGLTQVFVDNPALIEWIASHA